MFLDYKYCPKCKKKNQEFSRYPGHFNNICDNCVIEEKALKKANYIDALKAKSTEERLRKIEEWIYDHDKLSHRDKGGLIG